MHHRHLTIRVISAALLFTAGWWPLRSSGGTTPGVLYEPGYTVGDGGGTGTGGGGGDVCSLPPTSACGVSSGSQQLANDVLAYNASGQLILSQGPVTCADSPTALQSIQAIANGQCATTCPNYACQNPTTVTPSLLSGMINIANAATTEGLMTPRVTSVTGDTHEKNSLHYYGRAFDLGCQRDTDPWPCGTATSNYGAEISADSGGFVNCALHNPGTTNAHYHCSSSN